MKNLFNLDAPVIQFIGKVGYMMWMNVLWFICCIPIVTIGASTTALYRMMLNLREDKTCTAGAFFSAFRSNFKNATILWLLELVYVVAMYFYYYGICLIENNTVQLALLVPFCVLFLIGGMLFLYSFPLTAFFENSVKNTLRNALAMGLHHYRETVFSFALSLLPAIAVVVSPYWFLRLLYVWLLIAPGVLIYWISGLMNTVFTAYIPEE